MNILAINTTGKFAEIVCKNQTATNRVKMENAFSEHIMPCIFDCLNKSKLTIEQTDCFGLVTGPGSFTGIRIGMAVLKGIVCATSKKIVAVNSFELISYNIKDTDFLVLLDSGNFEHYYAIFKEHKCQEYGFSKIENLQKFAKENGLKIYYSSAEKSVFENYNDVNCVDVDENSLINLIEQKAKEQNFTAINELSPIYIKQSQAEVGLMQDINQNVKYRLADINDANALSIIDEQCFDGYEKYSEQTFVDELSLSDRHYIVATHKNLVVGYVGLWQTGNDLNLLKIAVLPQFRKLGLGFNLMQKASDYRSQQGLDKYFLEVRENNEKAIKLYKKFGFKTVDVRKKYYADGENCLVMFAK